MDAVTIGLRTHDMNPGLLTVSSGLISTYFRSTRLMGSAAQVITLLSGLQVVRLRPLLAAAGELGVDDVLLERTLRELEELDQVRVIQEASGDQRIEVRVRRVQDRYGVIGERWKETNPTEIEEVAIDLLEQLSVTPRYDSDIRETYGLSEDDFGMLVTVLSSCGVLGSYESPVNGRTILFSPLYWEDNPQSFFKLTEIHGADDVTTAIKAVRGYQGLPEGQAGQGEVLRAVVESGILPTTTVVSTAGPKRFVFTPLQGAKRVEKKLLQKAYALISCIRYGQHHARITKLKWSAHELLQHLKDAKKIGPHSEARAQYSPLVELFVGRIEEESEGKFTFHLFDTQENMRALDTAIELAAIGETPIKTAEAEHAASRLLLPPGSFHDPTRTRIDVKRSVRRTKESASKIAAIISGVSSDVV